MSFQRNRFGIEQEIIEISEKDLADKVIVREQFLKKHRSTKDKLFVCKIVNIFLSISLNVCFGCSKEPSH